MACRCPKQIRRRVVPKLWGDNRSHGTGRFGGLDAGRRDCEADYTLRFGIAGLDTTGLAQKCRKEQRVIGAPRPKSAAVDRNLMGWGGESQSQDRKSTRLNSSH